MISWIYWWGLVTLGMLIFSFLIKEYVVGALASMSLMALGVYVIANGFPTISNTLTQLFGSVMISIGAYVLIRGGYELLFTK